MHTECTCTETDTHGDMYPHMYTHTDERKAHTGESCIYTDKGTDTHTESGDEHTDRYIQKCT